MYRILKNKIMPKLCFGAACVLSLLLANPAQADSLETMERERAQLVKTMLDPTLSPTARETKLISAKRRLADMERRVLRDDGLMGKNDATTRMAFDNYDLSFLIHASSEHNRSLVDQWLSQVGVTTHSVMNATTRRR
ncbi:MAG: hypothetical protein AB8B77_06470 [Alphaproteobacteria bacterium]